MNDITVQDVMTRYVVAFSAGDTIHDAARILATNDISGAPVVEEGRVVGMISEADLLHALAPPTKRARTASVLDALEVMRRTRPPRGARAITVGEAMSSFIVEIRADASLWEASSLMERKGVKRLPVVDADDRLVGIISRADVVRAIARSDRQLKGDVEKAISVLGEDTFLGLEVSVEDGVAMLQGTADRRSTHELAVKLARRVPGVVDVVDQLDHGFDDSSLPVVYGPKDPRLDWNADLSGFPG